MLDSKAITKIQSLILVAVIIVAAVGGGAVYLFLNGEEQTENSIKIGVLADLDGTNGKHVWQGALLAAEELNAEGGLLGIQVEVIGEDSDTETQIDLVKVSSALTRLLTYHNVDFVFAHVSGSAALTCQDIIAEHKKVMLQFGGPSDTMNQRVLDDYEKYKYFFRTAWNATSVFNGMTDSLLLLRERTGFNKIGILSEDASWAKDIINGLEYVLPEIHGFELVYSESFPLETIDFSSYFAAAEVAEVEVLFPLIASDGGVPFIKEWSDRQSPMFVYGGVLYSAAVPESWEWTDGKCNNIVTAAFPINTGYPLTSVTLPARDAYIEKWGETPLNVAGWSYDALRFILADAIKRAETIETEAVLTALEETSIETTQAKNFVFTESHGVMMGENFYDPDEDYLFVLLFQWQNGELIPVYPRKILEQTQATYTFPPWSGPWDDQ